MILNCADADSFIVLPRFVRNIHSVRSMEELNNFYILHSNNVCFCLSVSVT